MARAALIAAKRMRCGSTGFKGVLVALGIISAPFGHDMVTTPKKDVVLESEMRSIHGELETLHRDFARMELRLDNSIDRNSRPMAPRVSKDLSGSDGYRQTQKQ